MAVPDKIVVITKRTALEELTERFNTPQQAKFYLARAREQRLMEDAAAAPQARARRSVPRDVSVEEYQAAHDAYRRSLDALQAAIPRGVRVQYVERSFLPTITFGDTDLVVTLGQDGLVVNTAKYLAGQPLLALNPDPQRIDGVLIPFIVPEAGPALAAAVQEELPAHHISMAKVELNDGQALYAVNDLFVGQQTHVSARYRLVYDGRAEDQSSSGIIVSTGAGSTGWFRSILTGAAEIVKEYASIQEAAAIEGQYRFDWEAEYLYFSVREPFVSRTSSAGLAFGRIEAGHVLEVISQMPQNGIIFGDGIEADYLAFNSGSTARIGLADRKLHLLANPHRDTALPRGDRPQHRQPARHGRR